MNFNMKTVQLRGSFESITQGKLLEDYIKEQISRDDKIEKFIFQYSGPLVTFNDAKVARSFASRSHKFLGIQFGGVLVEEWSSKDFENQDLDSKLLMSSNPPIFVEDPEKKKLLFYGLNEDCLKNVELLQKFIENCSKASIEQLLFGPNNDRILVLYKDEPDYNNVLSVLRLPFNDTMVSVQKLPKTTSFQVMDDQFITDETLGNMMLKRVGGTMIITLEDEDVAERFQSKTTNEHSFLVPFYEEFGVIPKGFDWLKPSTFTPPDITIKSLDKIVYDFLVNNKSYQESLESALNKLQCSVIWQYSDLSSSAASAASITLRWSTKHAQEKVFKSWTSDVVECFQQHIGALDHCNIQVSPSEFSFVMFHARGIKSSNKNLVIEIDKETNRFIAAGPKEEVSDFKNFIGENRILANNIYFEVEGFKPYEMQLVKLLPAYESIKQICNIQVFEDKTECLMLLTGFKERVKDVQSKFIDLKNKIQEDVVERFSKCPTDFFKQTYVVKKIEENFKQRNVVAVLRVDNGILKLHSFHDLDVAQESLMSIITISKCKLPSDAETIMQGQAWATLTKLNKYSAWCKNGNEIFLYAFTEDSEEITRRLNKHFDEYSKVDKIVEVPPTSMEFMKLCKKFDKIKKKAEIKAVELKILTDKKPAFQIAGRRKEVAHIEEDLRQLSSKFEISCSARNSPCHFYVNEIPFDENDSAIACPIISTKGKCSSPDVFSPISNSSDNWSSPPESLHSDKTIQSTENDCQGGQLLKIELPTTWRNMQNCDVELVVLNSSCAQFGEVESLFSSGLPGLPIVKIERVQNPDLYRMYRCMKFNMVNRKVGAEKRLWRGTSPDTVPKINKLNFKRAFAQRGESYIKGINFHTSPKHCVKHCTLGKDKRRCIYLVRALTGKVGQGAQHLVEPPLVREGSMEYYDSVADDIISPTTYEIFDEYQVYPEYLITF